MINIEIGDKVLDKTTSKVEIVINKTDNSVEVSRTKLNKKGVNCTNWFTEQNFNKQFTKQNSK